MKSERTRLLDFGSTESLSSSSSYGGMVSRPAAGHDAQLPNGEESLQIHGFQKTRAREALFWTLTICTLGIFRLLVSWSEKWYLRFRARPCALDVADLVYIVDDHNQTSIRFVQKLAAHPGEYLLLPTSEGEDMVQVESYRWFTFKKMKYVWMENEVRFVSPVEFDERMKITKIHTYHNDDGLSTSEVLTRKLTYGKNLIEVKVKPIYQLFIKEVLTPFYIFQIFSVSVWYTDNYEYYASVIVVMTLGSIVTELYQMRKQETKLRAMIHSESDVDVLRDGKISTVSSEELVPGDTIIIPRHGCTLQCDVVLMCGSVIVNESMLTGESIPITKVSLGGLDEDNSDGNLRFCFDRHARHTLFCGTKVLQTRFYGGKPVKAIVVRTAYSTLKGQLVRSIMYPKPVDFRFTRDLFKFVFFLFGIAAIGFSYTIWIMIKRGADLKKIIIRSLDIITVVVPPALPAAMSVGIINSKMRLKKKNIFCISPSTINTCGAINVCCFDKTGTLTEDGLDFLSMMGIRNKKGKEDEAEFTSELRDMDPTPLPINGELVKAIATCHSLTRIDGTLNGDPLDLILFNQTKWTIEETAESENEEKEAEQETTMFDNVQPSVLRPPPGSAYGAPEFTIIRQFPFSSSLQRMSVIVGAPETADSHQMVLYSKGSPEMIKSLCRPETCPDDYMDVVNEYAQHGYRLIAVARRIVDIGFAKAAKVARNQVECDLQLLGLVVMENRVKPQTLGVINQLNRANIRTVMVTGDNLLTGLSVARECGIIRPEKKTYLVEHSNEEKDSLGRPLLTLRQSVSSSEDIVDEGSFVTELELRHMIDSAYQFAISGPTFAIITHEYPELMPKLGCVCDVFARMAPDQKKQLVNLLQDIDYTVAFCGDGANDCAALKAAHAGISLSEAEASIAAPFTSKTPDISCVPEVIREGRAALVTSFGIFKYMAGYSLTQFISIMQLYWLSTNLTDMQFLYIDLFLITTCAFFFGNTPACEHLSSTPPPTRLLSVGSVCSIIGQLIIIATSQLSVFVVTAQQEWFSPFTVPHGEDDENKASMQGTAIFGVSVFQYIALAVIYSKGAPYRKTIFHNVPFVILICILCTFNLVIVLFPPPFMISFLEYDPIPLVEFRLVLVLVSLLSIFLMFPFETVIIDYFLHDKRENYRQKKLLKKRGVGGEDGAQPIDDGELEVDDSESTGCCGLRKRGGIDADENNEEAGMYERLLVKIGNEPSWMRQVARYLPADVIRPTASAPSLRPKTPNGDAAHPALEVVDETRGTDGDDESADA